MADAKISALPASTTPLAGTEVLPIVQSGATKQVSIANLTAGRAVSADSLTLTGTALTAANGGTGQSSYAVGDLLYASSTTALSKLADVATGNALISGGVGTAPSWGKVGLTTHVSGTLGTGNGGTGLTSFTANGVVYASSTSALATGSDFYYNGTSVGTTKKFYSINSTFADMSNGSGGSGGQFLYTGSTAGAAPVTIECNDSETNCMLEFGVYSKFNAAIQARVYSNGATGALNLNPYGGTVNTGGNLAVTGALSKGSGSFRIEHPLPSKKDTHELVHSFIEGPQADLIYRGRVTLVNGKASVNIDEAAGMTNGTFEVLCRNVQCFTTNEDGFANVRGKVVGNVLSIDCEHQDCSDNISWMVIGERQDKHMYQTDWTDENGKVIVEPLKPQPMTDADLGAPIERAAV